MMEDRYHATTQNRIYPDMSSVNKNITVEPKLISPPTYLLSEALAIFSDCVQYYINDRCEILADS
jgi:hypothetical protein